MKNFVCCVLFLLTALQLSAQDVSVTIKVSPDKVVSDVSLFISPLTADFGTPVEMGKNQNVFKAKVPLSPSEFYNVISVRNGAQMFFPIYNGNKETKNFEIDFSKGVPQLSKATAEDRALGQYFEYVYANDKKMWTEPFASVDEVRPFLEGYLQKAETLARSGINAKVAGYLKMWAYTHVFDLYTSLPFAAHIQLSELPFTTSDLLSDPVEVLNAPTAMLFRSTPQIVFSLLKNKKNLDLCLTQLHATYSQPELLKKVTTLVVENYLGTFDYEAHFDKGLAELESATKKYGLDPSYAKDFAKCKATIKGQPFPSGVVLKDVDGKVVDFSKFRGKYVYIDMWASWCGPCCKEVPVLQNLEKNLKNDQVVFVSISGDTNEASWKKKMTQLNMHGNQLINADNSLTKALNVRGIPFFVIYDPEGRMYLYDAPRPSQGQGLVEMLEHLK